MKNKSVGLGTYISANSWCWCELFCGLSRRSGAPNWVGALLHGWHPRAQGLLCPLEPASLLCLSK